MSRSAANTPGCGDGELQLGAYAVCGPRSGAYDTVRAYRWSRVGGQSVVEERLGGANSRHVYDARGRLLELREGERRERFVYARGPHWSEARVDFERAPNALELQSASFDALGRVERIVRDRSAPGGGERAAEETLFAYDAAGWLTSTDWHHRGYPGTPERTTHTRSPDGRTLRSVIEREGNPTRVEERAFDTAGLVVSRVAGPSSVRSTRGERGRVLAMREVANGATTEVDQRCLSQSLWDALLAAGAP